MTANDFTNLHLQYLSTQAEGELPATIEHDFHNGRMVDHYFVTPSPNFWNDEAIKALEGVTGIMFLQQPIAAKRGRERIGKCYDVLIEQFLPEEGLYLGRSYGEAPEVDGMIAVESDAPLTVGDYARVRILRADDYELLGRAVQDE